MALTAGTACNLAIASLKGDPGTGRIDLPWDHQLVIGASKGSVGIALQKRLPSFVIADDPAAWQEYVDHPPRDVAWLGFHRAGGQSAIMGPTQRGWAVKWRHAVHGFMVPGWLATATLAAYPIVWYRRVCRQSRARARSRAGCCARCGYDLRATPARCPECGVDTATG